MRFARELPEGSPFAPREALAGRDARTLARKLLGMAPDDFSTAFRGSPMRRAKLGGLKRNAAVVLGNVGTVEDVPILQQTLDTPEPPVGEHAAWALDRLGRRAQAARRAGPESRDEERDVPLGRAPTPPRPSSAT